MSMRIKSRSIVDSLEEIRQGFTQVAAQPLDSFEGKISAFINVLEEKKK